MPEITLKEQELTLLNTERTCENTCSFQYYSK